MTSPQDPRDPDAAADRAVLLHLLGNPGRRRALLLEGALRSPDNDLRFAVAVIGTAIALFTVVRPAAGRALLYLLSIGYLAYFAAASAWHGLWRVAAAAPTEGVGRDPRGDARARDPRHREGVRPPGATASPWRMPMTCAVMPIVQLIVVVYLARVLVGNRRS